VSAGFALAGLNVGQAIGGPAARFFNERVQRQRETELFPLQVQSLKASIAGEEARSGLLKQQTADLTQIHDLLAKWLGGGDADPSLETAFVATQEALRTIGSGRSVLSGLQQDVASQYATQSSKPAGVAPRPIPPDIAVRQPQRAPAKTFAENVRSALLHAAQTVRGDPTSPPVQMAPYVSSGSGGPSNFGQMPEPGWMANLLASGALPDQEGPSMSPGPSLDEALRRLETARVMAMKQPDVPDPLGVNPAQQAFQAALKDVYTWLQMVGPLPEAQMYGPLQQMYGPAQEFFPTYGRRIGNVPYANRPVPYGPQQMPQFTRTLLP
jgi:hypothetical protein